MKDELKDYMIYKRCKVCGKITDEDIFDDNNGICDDCFTDENTWNEQPIGNYYED